MSQGDVFLLDDNAENLELLSRILAERGIAVRIANSARRGLSILRAHPPDLVLLDIVMPDMDGYEVCERLKSDEATHEIPVIFVSALFETLDKVRAFGAGGVDYVTKPFQPDEVVARVESQLRISRLRKERDARSAELRTAYETLRRSEVKLLEAQEQLAGFARSSSARLEDPSSWVAVIAAEIARTIGVEGIGVWERVRGELVPLSPAGMPRPSWRPGLPEGEAWEEDEVIVIPIIGTAGDARGALAVQGPPGVRKGAVERQILASFASHLGTALEIRRLRAELETDEDRKADVLDLLDIGVLFVGPKGEILRANRRAGEMLREADGLSGGPGGLRGSTKAETELLLRAVARGSASEAGDESPPPDALAVGRPTGRRPYLVSVFPAQDSRLTLRGEAPAALVFVVDPERASDPPVDALMQVYGLTKAEAAVAGQLLLGRSPEEASGALGVTLNTVRSHVKRLMMKTDTRRQADLVRTLLLSSLPVRRGQEAT